MKKILVIGAIALVIFGCVLAAGCTSTTSSPSSDDQIIGNWVKNDGTSGFVLEGNNIGTYYTLKDGEVKQTAIAWVKNNDGTYTIGNDETKTTVTLDPVKGQFTCDSGCIFIKIGSNQSGSLSSMGIDGGSLVINCIELGNCPWS